MGPTTHNAALTRGSIIHSWARNLPLWLFAAGVAVRLWFAQWFFLNPDEALHYLLSLQPNLRLTYEATLSTSHPPLYIVFLHYWGYLGTSEFFLRLPSVLAASLFCVLMFQWMKLVTNDRAALICFALLLFSPSLIYVSTELRQYAFVLCFSAAALYFLDLALQRGSPRTMAASGISLCLALLTHYSAALVALTLGIYAVWRIASVKPPASVLLTWATLQSTAVTIALVLFRTQLVQLKARGRFVMAAETYLKRSSFHPGEESAIAFLARATIRLFHYFFSQGAVGVVALALFILAIVVLYRDRPASGHSPMPKQLALLLTFPLLINMLLALRDLYPYGGTRHSSYLTIFIFPGIAIALSRIKPAHAWRTGAVLAVVLLLCNLFPSPTGEYIRHRDQNRKQMQTAANFLRENANVITPIVTDNQGGLLLSYYLCNSKVVPFSGTIEHFSQAPCKDTQVFSLDPRQWIFKASSFPDDVRALKTEFQLATGQSVWVFQSGWLVDNEADFRRELKHFGCASTHDFGRNILACRIVLP